MKRFILILLLLATTKIYSQTLTATGSSNVLTTSATCSGTYTGTYDTEGDLLVQYSVNSNFANPKASLYITASDTSGGVITINITGLMFNTTYYFRFKGTSDSDGLLKTSNSLNFTTANLIQASNIQFTNIQSTQVTASFTPGDGDNRIVLVKQGSAVDSDPVDGTTYTANGTFGSGTQIGTGNYVVAKGDINSSLVTGLTTGNIYYFKVYEYTGVGSTSNFRIDGFPAGTNPNSVNLTGEPTTQATSVNFTSVAQTSFTANWTRGNGDSVLVVAKASTIANGPTDGTHYNASATFASGAAIDGGYVVYKGTGTSVAITGLSAGTTYYIMAYEYNTASSIPNYKTGSATGNPNSQATLKAEPATQASNISFSSLATTSVNLSWTAGNGDGRIVVAHVSTDGEVNPSDGTDYTANSAFGSGNITGANNFVVYKGTGTSGSVTNLAANTTYTFKVYEYNNSGTAIDYKIDGYPAGSNPNDTTTLKLEPATQATSLIFTNVTGNSLTIDWTSGDGDGAVLIARTGTAITNFPADGTTYTDDLAFGSGSNLGNSTFVLYSGAGTTANITGLSGNTTYYFMVCESNNAGTGTNYKTTPATGNPNSQATLKAEPATQASNINFSALATTSVILSWTAGNGDGRIVVAHVSNDAEVDPSDGTDYTANSVFGSGNTTGANNFVVYKGTGTSGSVTNLTANTTYTFKVYEYNNSGTAIDYKIDGYPAGSNPNDTTTFKVEPSTQATSLIFSNVTSNSLTIDWTTGDGDGAVLIARAGTAIANFPADGTTYTANLAFGSGSNLGNSTFVLYSGAGTTANITGLSGNTTYYFMVCESNNNGAGTDYKTTPALSNPNSQLTLKTEPTTQASNINFSGLATTSVNLSWTAGNGDGRIVVARVSTDAEVDPSDGTDYTANSAFGSGNITGANNFVVYKGTGTSGSVTNLIANTTYTFKVYEYNNSGTSINYKIDGFPAGNNPNDTTTLNIQPTQATNLLFTNVTATSMTVNWTTGDGDGAMLIARASSAIANFPVDGTTYTANLAFGSGSDLGNSTFVLYSGSGTTANITGLSAGITYYFMVCESNNAGPGTDYNTNPASNNPLNQATLKIVPTTQTSSILFSSVQANQLTLTWTNGDGDNRVVLMKQASAVNATPTNGTTYSANTVFGSGAQIGSGNYVVYNNNSNTTTVTNLLAGTTYFIKIFEYNNTGTEILYKTDGFGATNPADTITPASAPTTQATNLVFSNILTNAITLNWTRGNGDSVLIVAKAGSTLTETPTNGTAYTDNTTFASGEAIATGVYAVYTGIGSSVTITGLTASTEYVFKAFEFKNGEPYTIYLTSDATNNPLSQLTTGSEPTVQAANIAFANTTSTQTDVTWTAGTGGTGRIVLCHANTPVDANPVDGFTYTANAAFGSGTQIGTGNYVVALGNITGITPTGLTPETEYHFKVYEYSGSGGSINYLLSDGTDNPDSITTIIGKPVTQATNITFTNLNTTSYRVGWTRGSGQNVLVVGVAGAFTAGENPVDASTYTPNATFASGTAIGSGYVVYNGNTPDYIDVTALTANTNYSFKVFEYNTPATDPFYQTNDGTNNPLSRYTLATEPTSQTSAVSYTSIGSTQVTLSWTGGDGTNRIVVAHAGTDIVSHPIDGTGYTDNSVFASGDEIGTAHYVVYNGAGAGVTVTGLNPNTVYYFRAYEYNGTLTSCNYLTSLGSSSDTTTVKAEPTLQAQGITFSALTSTSYTVNWTRGDAVNNDSVIILAHQGAAVDQFPADGTYGQVASSVFGSGTEIGTGNFVVYKGIGTSAAISGLTLNNEYHFRAFEFNNTGTSTDYLTTTATGNPNSSFTLDQEPTTQASNITFPNVGADTIQLSWTNGDGTGRIVVACSGSAVTAIPSDEITYTANAIFGSGTAITPGNYVVYAGTSNSFVVRGLTGGVTYHFQVFEYNNTGVINYNTATATGNPSSQLTGVAGAPTIQASNITFSSINTTSFTINWTSGNGTNRIVALKAGSGVITNPSDNTTYGANTVFPTGNQLGSSQYYIVYNGNSNSVNVTGLSANTAYFAQIFEYNNAPGSEVYLTTTGTNNPNDTSTLKLAPINQDSLIVISNITTSSMDITWSNGDGENRICVINTSNSFATSYDGTSPSTNTVYAGGEQVLFNGPGTTVTVTGLSTSTTYYFHVFNYNNTGASTLFNTSDNDNNPNSAATLGTANWIGGDTGNETDWGTAANWSTLAVPTSSYSVVIPSSATYMPDITSSENADYVTINAGASLTISDGGILSVANDFLLQTPADAGSSGMLVIPGTGTISISGNTVMERYIPSTTNWHFASYPNSPNIAAFTGYFANSYNEATLNWDHLTSASSIATMQGITVKYSSGSQTRSFSGGFNNGNQSINVTNSSPGDDSYGWNLVGNPYPCTIDWDAASGWTLNNVDATAYYYNASGGSYSSFNSSSSTGTNGGTQYIASAQGFFVHASDNGSLAMTNAVRVANTENYRKNGTIEKQLIRIEVSNEEYKSDAVLLFYSDATDGFDAAYDALKLIATNEDISDIYFNANQSKYSINTYSQNKLQELNDNEILIFPLGITPGKTGLVTFKLSEITQIPSEVFVYLFDKQQNLYYDLKTNSYDFFIGETTDTRFELHLTKTAVGYKENLLSSPDIFIYTSNKTTFIKSTLFEQNKGEIQVFDIMGRLILAKLTEYSNLQEFTINLSGTYIIRIISNNSITTQKVVVE